ncbi:hypothetical protein JCM3774_000935 [Rhodotorula dairenensis]
MASVDSHKPRREAGLLVIVVLKAQHLHDRHHPGSKQDPFVEVEVTNSGKARTAADIGGGEQPLWDEEFRMRVYEIDGEQQYLQIRAMRATGGADHELIGEAKVRLDGSWTEFDEWVAIKEAGQYRGEVYLELTWYPRANHPDFGEDESLQRRPSRLDSATRLSRLPTEPSTPSVGADRLTGIDFIPRDRSKDLEFTCSSSGVRPPGPPPKDQAETTYDSGRLPLPGESDETCTPPAPSPASPLPEFHAVASGSSSLPLPSPTQSYPPRGSSPSHIPPPTASPEPISSLAPPSIVDFSTQGSVSLPPRPTTRTPLHLGPPVPPRPTSAAPGLQPLHRSDPLVVAASTSVSSLAASLTPPTGDLMRPSPSPPRPGRPASSRPLPAAPTHAAAQVPISPLEAKRREAANASAPRREEPAPPAYSPSPAPRTPSFPGAFPSVAPPDVEAEARRSRELLQHRREEEERDRTATEARRRAAEETKRQQLEAERLAAEERKRKSEEKRLEAIQASQRAREERLRQEQEDARIAAQMAEEAEAAERDNLARRRAEDEALAKRLLAEEEAERARLQLERQRIDEDFVRQLREEDQQREDDERRAREEADAAFARRMREEEEAETRRRIEEDERVARSLAEQDQRRRTPTAPVAPPGLASSGRPRQPRP